MAPVSVRPASAELASSPAVKGDGLRSTVNYRGGDHGRIVRALRADRHGLAAEADILLADAMGGHDVIPVVRLLGGVEDEIVPSALRDVLHGLVPARERRHDQLDALAGQEEIRTKITRRIIPETF